MLRIVKDIDNLEIKNVICFFVGSDVPEDYDKVSKKKETDWTYQDYLTVACHKAKYDLYWFNKKYVQYTFTDGIISVNDPTTDIHISFNKDNRKDTIIFQGQANDEPGVNYEGLLRAFEYLEFFMLNTFDEIRMASDKMLSANLLSSKNIPQPRYALVTKEIMQDDKNHDATRESFWKLLDTLYDANENVDAEKKVRQYVVKILGGSLGIGVFICTHNEIESILQTLFQIDENRQLIIQEYKVNTGDIRAHAFSVDGVKYEILAVMKRNKIAKDFRSNVSLGATTQSIDITDEQKKIILDTAKLSGCRWVGVDLMDCEDGSNVVIEYNSSPGVQGISQQIKKNMFTIVLDKVSDYFKKHGTKDDEETDSYIKNTKVFSGYDKDVLAECAKEWTDLSKKRKKVLNECLGYIPGTHYVKHGKDNIEDGLDCSGYVRKVYKDSIGVHLPKMCVGYFINQEDAAYEEIKRSELKPGDIGIKNDTTKDNHIGIYVGDDKWFENNLYFGTQLTDYGKFKYFFRVKDIDKE